jgi:hypothetical protein
MRGKVPCATSKNSEAEMLKLRIAALGAMLLFASTQVLAAKPPDTWDGLLKVQSKRLDLVYLLPDADFRSYSKVMLDPVQAAFRKNWQRDNSTVTGRVSDQDARQILDRAGSSFTAILTDAYNKAGYQVVSAPGPDVLRVSAAVVNLDIQAPDKNYAGRSRTYSREAGGATFAVEVRDSLSGELLGRAVDSRSTGDNGPYLRNSTTNTWEFESLFRRWAKISIDGLNELKALSPINAEGLKK